MSKLRWKDHPSLFANGKFKARGTDGTGQIKEFTIYEDGSECFTIHDEDGFWVDDCIDSTLIARKIEDMTDEETELFGRYGYADKDQPEVWQDIRNLISEHASRDLFCPSEFIRLIGLGVYPFDQIHFESVEVLDIKEIEK